MKKIISYLLICVFAFTLFCSCAKDDSQNGKSEGGRLLPESAVVYINGEKNDEVVFKWSDNGCSFDIKRKNHDESKPLLGYEAVFKDGTVMYSIKNGAASASSDENGNTVYEYGDVDNAMGFSFDSNGYAQKIIFDRGDTMSIIYGKDRITADIDTEESIFKMSVENGVLSIKLTESTLKYSFNDWGDLVKSEADGETNEFEYEYDAQGNITRIKFEYREKQYEIKLDYSENKLTDPWQRTVLCILISSKADIIFDRYAMVAPICWAYEK